MMPDKIKVISSEKNSLLKEQQKVNEDYAAKINALEKTRIGILSDFVKQISPYKIGDIVKNSKGMNFVVTEINPYYSEFSDLCGFRIYAKRMLRNKKLSVNAQAIFYFPTPQYKLIANGNS